jgi:hypothetical protein
MQCVCRRRTLCGVGLLEKTHEAGRILQFYRALFGAKMSALYSRYSRRSDIYEDNSMVGHSALKPLGLLDG